MERRAQLLMLVVVVLLTFAGVSGHGVYHPTAAGWVASAIAGMLLFGAVVA